MFALHSFYKFAARMQNGTTAEHSNLNRGTSMKIEHLENLEHSHSSSIDAERLNPRLLAGIVGGLCIDFLAAILAFRLPLST